MSSILTAASDIALVLDDTGIIRNLTIGQSEHPIEEARGWLGRGWVDTVTPESRKGILDMLKEADTDGVSRRRQVNHISVSGVDIPVTYTTVRLDEGEHRLVAVGRDLRAISALQQRLVEAQQSLERDYRRMRHSETEYRLLFQVTPEAVLVVDATTLKVVEANPAASTLFDQPARKLVGRGFPFEFDRPSESLINDALGMARSRGRADDLVGQMTDAGPRLTVSIALVRQDTTTLFLIRMSPLAMRIDGTEGLTLPSGSAVKLIESLPDGFVVTDGEGRIGSANRAFLDLVHLPTLEQVRGRLLSQWMGRPGADLSLLLSTVREHGVVRLFGTLLRSDLGWSTEVEVSSISGVDGSSAQFGFLIRDVSRRVSLGPAGARDLTRAVEQLTALVGKVSLKNLVRDTTDLVERHFIQAALETTGDNRTSAAEVLGVSRQSLYVKLRRHNLGADAAPAVQPPGQNRKTGKLARVRKLRKR